MIGGSATAVDAGSAGTTDGGAGPGAPAAAIRLARLLPRREVLSQLEPFLALLPGRALRVLDEAGIPLAESRSQHPPAAAGEAHRAALVVAGAEVGVVEVDPAPVDDRERAAVRALTLAVQRSANAAHGRRALVAETLERYREVNLLYRLGELLGDSTDPAALPRLVLEEGMQAIAAEGGVLVLDADAGGFEAAVVAVGPHDAALLERTVATTRAAAGSEARAAVVTEGSSIDPRLRVRVWAPLRSRDRVLGALMLTRPDGATIFTAADAKLLTALATQSAAFIDSARLQQRSIEQARMTRELQLAYEVQARLMPQTLPQRPGWRVAASWRPALEVAGDFYDALGSGDAVALTVGDVADKGMAAAIFMALTRSVLRASLAPDRPPCDVVRRANALLCSDAVDGMFVTLVHVHLGAAGRARFANAGHNPPLVLRTDGGVERLGRTGILVGWDEGAVFGDAEIVLDEGEALVLYTDGVTEALDVDGRPYGEERLEAVATRHRGATAEHLLRALLDDLAAFVGTADPYDDATLMVVTREGADEADARG